MEGHGGSEDAEQGVELAGRVWSEGDDLTHHMGPNWTKNLCKHIFSGLLRIMSDGAGRPDTIRTDDLYIS